MTSHFLYFDVVVIFTEQPYFTDEPTSISVVEGGVAYFSCEAAGHPDPSITWSRNGKFSVYMYMSGLLVSARSLSSLSVYFICLVHSCFQSF